MTKFTLKKRIRQLKAQNKHLNKVNTHDEDQAAYYQAVSSKDKEKAKHYQSLANDRGYRQSNMSDELDTLRSNNQALENDNKQYKKEAKANVAKLKKGGLKMYDDMYLIYAGLGVDNDDDDECDIDSCRFHDPKAQGDIEPEWYINDPKLDIHHGFINYDHDLKRKLFTKAEVKEFYQRYLNFIKSHSSVSPVSIRSNAILSMLKADTMTFKEAKDKGLILTSDYTPSYNNYLHQLRDFEDRQEAMDEGDGDVSFGTC